MALLRVSPLEINRKGNRVAVRETEVEVSLKFPESEAAIRGLEGLFGI